MDNYSPTPMDRENDATIAHLRQRLEQAREGLVLCRHIAYTSRGPALGHKVTLEDVARTLNDISHAAQVALNRTER